MKLENLLYPQVLGEGGMACHARSHMGGMPRECAQPSRWGAEEDPWASAIFWVRVEYTTKMCEVFSMVHLNITKS